MNGRRFALCLAGVLGGVGMPVCLWLDSRGVGIFLRALAVAPSMYHVHSLDIRRDWGVDELLLSSAGVGLTIALALNSLTYFVYPSSESDTLFDILLWIEVIGYVVWPFGSLLYDLSEYKWRS